MVVEITKANILSWVIYVVALVGTYFGIDVITQNNIAGIIVAIIIAVVGYYNEKNPGSWISGNVKIIDE